MDTFSGEPHMNAATNQKMIPLFTLPLAILVIIISLTGILLPDTYIQETPNWTVQAIGQDIIDLFLITPVLLIAAYFAWKGSRSGALVWVGSLLYFAYTFVIYTFALSFNRFFLLYALTLGLSVYALLYFFYTLPADFSRKPDGSRLPVKTAGWFMVVLGCMFYLLWLSEIVPAAVTGIRPPTLIETGLRVNPVHALDISLLLPGLILTGILLLRKHPLGVLLTPVMLTFTLLMDITICFLMIILARSGFESAPGLIIFMSMLGIVNFVILYIFLKNLYTS